MAQEPGSLDIHVRRQHIARTTAQRPRLSNSLAKLGARGAVVPPASPQSQQVIVRVDTPRAGARGTQLGYLTHGKALDGSDMVPYGPGSDDAQAFSRQYRQDAHRFVLYVSCPDITDVQRMHFIGHYMSQVERDLGCPLDWLAVNHYDTQHPHTHVLLRGQSQGEELYMKKHYFTEGVRRRAQQVLTRLIGPRAVEELAQEHQVMAEHSQGDVRRDAMWGHPLRLGTPLRGKSFLAQGDGIGTGPQDPDALTGQIRALHQALAPQAGTHIYGHEGGAAHIDWLWAQMTRGGKGY
jgi:hypothetical protein